jgi:hypothetical protein
MGCDMKMLMSTVLSFFCFSALADEAQDHAPKQSRPLFDLQDNPDPEPPETVFDWKNRSMIGYGGAYWGTFLVDGSWLPAGGVRGAWTLTQNLTLGLDFSALLSRYHPLTEPSVQDVFVSFTSWGLFAEYTQAPKDRFHINYALALGKGGMNYESGSSNQALPSNLRESKLFHYVSPEVSLELNLTRYTRSFIGMRAFLPFAATGNDQLADENLRSISLFFGLKVGHFFL